MRLLTLLFLLLASIAHSRELAIQFIANMGVKITDGKTSLYSDFPFESGAFGYMKYDPKFLKNDSDSFSLITHLHRDHWAKELFDRSNWKLIAPPGIQKTVDASRIIPFSPLMKYKNIIIEAFSTPHGNLPEHYSYLVTWEGNRLYFTGDTESTDQLLKMKDLDAAFVSPWLIAEIAKRNQRIDTKKLIVYHHTEEERIPPLQNYLRPKQGDSFVLGM
jgi:L-ascorbate metabolism protein UlaG (beta-lactamase superfamily)